MNIIKGIWSRFLQLKLWAKIIVVLILISAIGAITGSGSGTTTNKSVVSQKDDSSQAAETPTPEATPTIDPEAQKQADAKAAAVLKQALASMRIKKDKVTNQMWYYAKSTTNYIDVNSVHIYIGQNDGQEPYLRFRIQYEGDDWIFIKKYTINVDGNIFTIEPEYGDVERDNDTNVWEWYDVNPSSENLEMLKAISVSKKAIIRCEGDQYHYDRTITASEKTALKKVFTVYGALLKKSQAA
jgi:hypothetical protein